MSDSSLDAVRTFLKDEIKELRVVVMPDFFLDRIVSLDCNAKTFSENLRNVARRKGGSIDGVRQTDIRGGNAVNTASALAALGVNVTPIICTNAFGLQLVKLYLGSHKIDLSHVKVLDEASITTALEVDTESGKANIMIRDIGALINFGPQHLDKEDLKAIETADYVCVFNWAGTRRFGTKLAKTVFCHVKAKGKGKSYYDTADPTTNEAETPKLVKEILQSELLDILSINESEAICYASQLSSDVKKLRKRLQSEDLAKESAKILATHLSARVDLHTTQFSATFSEHEEIVVPAFKVPVLRATGAGDAWNAGNIVGDASGLSNGGRLSLANAAAAFYISDPGGAHATRKQLIEFFKKQQKTMS